MYRLSLLFTGILFFIYGCNPGGQVIQDGKISTSVSSEINALNEKLIAGFAAQDPSQVLPLCSEQMAKHGPNSFLAIMQQIGKRFNTNTYHIQNQFYIKHATEGTTVKVGTGGKQGYTISFQAANSELFVSVGYFDSKVQSPALIVVYGKYGNNWKLNILQVGLMQIEGKDANAWHAQAQTDMNKGCLADAANDMVLCNLVNEPANQFWHYAQENEFIEFDKRLTLALNKQYVFPLVFKNVPTQPQVFRIFPQVTNEGYFPMVVYKTNIKLTDTVALAKECDQMHQQIGSVFKGISAGKKYIFYRVCAKIPADKNEQVPNHGFVRKGNL